MEDPLPLEARLAPEDFLLRNKTLKQKVIDTGVRQAVVYVVTVGTFLYAASFGGIGIVWIRWLAVILLCLSLGLEIAAIMYLRRDLQKAYRLLLIAYIPLVCLPGAAFLF